MKFSVTLTVFALFLAVLGAYVYLMPVERLPAIEAPSAVGHLLPLEKDDAITGIVIIDPSRDRTVALSKIEESWFMTEPVYSPASEPLARGLAAALVMSRKARTLLPEKDWDEYGLESPGLKIGVATRKYPGTRFLLVGDTTPAGNLVYAKWEGEDEFFLLDENLKYAFDKSPYAFREKRLFPMSLKDIRRLRVQTPHQSYEIIQTEREWAWMEPVMLLGSEVAQEDMSRLMADIQNTFIKEFLEEEGTAGKGFGLLGRGISVKVWEKSGSEIELEIGEESPGKDAYFARRRGEEAVFLVARDKIHGLFSLLQAMAEEKTEEETGDY